VPLHGLLLYVDQATGDSTCVKTTCRKDGRYTGIKGIENQVTHAVSSPEYIITSKIQFSSHVFRTVQCTVTVFVFSTALLNLFMFRYKMQQVY
jgi:hypothetical protein